MTPYKEFAVRFKLLISKNPHLNTTTLSNIFTMRLIGNNTHGDLAEIAIAEFINQYMYDFRSVHVGKEAPRRFVWNPTGRIDGRRRARWACGQVACRPVHMSTGRV